MAEISRSPHGERGLKSATELAHSAYTSCRSPHGERGLKYVRACFAHGLNESLSSWRAWIEICMTPSRLSATPRSLSSWRAWIEISRTRVWRVCTASRSPHGERGLKYARCLCMIFGGRRSPHGERGLKFGGDSLSEPVFESLSSWRAWIEMSRRCIRRRCPPVALLMESVD